MEARIHPETTSAIGAQQRRRGPVHWGDIVAPYLFISPFILSFLVLFAGPSIYSLVLSFHSYKGYGTATFIGLANYDSILNYYVFWTQLRNTVIYWLGHVFILMICSFLLAMLVRSKLVHAKSIVKPIIFLPNIVAEVAAALVFQSLFGTKYGVVNRLLGIEVPWLQDMRIARFVVIFLQIWRGAGWWFVIYLAGLTAVNPELEEAAMVDGASGLQRLRFIILPLMRSTFLFAFVLDAIGSFRMFALPNVLVGTMGNLAPVEMAPLLNLVISNLQGAQFGKAAAAAWLVFLIIAAVSYIQFRISRSASQEGSE